MTSTSPEAQEKKLLHALVLLHALAITLPYAWAAGIVGEGLAWSGLLFSPDDQLVHLAWARQTQEGSFFIRDPFTTENLSDNSRPLFFNALTFAIGIVSRLSTLEVAFAYHAVRVACAILGLYALHALTRRWSNDWRVRLSTVAIAAFAGGAGWLRELAPQVLGGLALIDRPDSIVPMMPEAWGFASNFIFAINAASLCLLCLAHERLLRARDGDRRALLVAALAAFFLSNIHTYDALPLIAVVAIATLIEARRGKPNWKPSLAVISAAMLPIVWQGIVYASSEEFRIKADTPTSAPPFVGILFSYSPLLILATVGIVAMKRGRLQVLEAGRVWPLVWLGVTVVAIYAPVSFARKMIEGLHLPLAFLAALGLVSLLERLPRTVRRPAWAGAIGVLSISMLQFVGWCVGEGWRDNSQSRGLLMPPVLLTQGDAGALKYLNAQPSASKHLQAVLCHPKVGNYVPRATAMSAFAGHWAETLRLGNKLGQLEAFYTGRMSPAEARAWLKSNRIGWVLQGQYESALGGNVGASYPFLREAWAQGESWVFRVGD